MKFFKKKEENIEKENCYVVEESVLKVLVLSFAKDRAGDIYGDNSFIFQKIFLRDELHLRGAEYDPDIFTLLNLYVNDNFKKLK